MNPCIGLLVGMLVLVVLLIRKAPLWLIFIITGTLIAILAGGLQVFPGVMERVIYSTATWDLVTIMFLIAVFVMLYRETGFVDQLSKELAALLQKPCIVSMLVPAVLGLLPVPGGALMSAPVVDKMGEYIGLSRARRAFVNVWFRHVIFIVYPLSTVLVMTAVMTGNSIWDIVLIQIPVALAMIVVGYFIGFPRKKQYSGSAPIAGKRDNKALAKTMLPILVTITIAVSTSWILDYRLPIPVGRLSMIVGVLTGIILLASTARLSLNRFTKVLISREPVELALIGFTAMYMRSVFESIDLSCVTAYLSTANTWVLLVSVPMFFSLAVGIVSSGVALSISILGAIVELNVKNASLIYLSAFMGYLGSPLHLCYIYTVKYMKTTLIEGYKYLVPAIALTMLITLPLYSIL